jgi:hypothetical protein
MLGTAQCVCEADGKWKGDGGGHILGSAGFTDDKDVAEYGICGVTHAGDDTCVCVHKKHKCAVSWRSRGGVECGAMMRTDDEGPAKADAT